VSSSSIYLNPLQCSNLICTGALISKLFPSSPTFHNHHVSLSVLLTTPSCPTIFPNNPSILFSNNLSFFVGEWKYIPCWKFLRRCEMFSSDPLFFFGVVIMTVNESRFLKEGRYFIITLCRTSTAGDAVEIVRWRTAVQMRSLSVSCVSRLGNLISIYHITTFSPHLFRGRRTYESTICTLLINRKNRGSISSTGLFVSTQN
jgi:hypothetical protein